MKIDAHLAQTLKVTESSQDKKINIANDNPRLSPQKMTDQQPSEKVEPHSIQKQVLNLSMHEKSGLLQSIVSEKLSGDIIRKMPADEYLDLVHFISEIVRGSLDEEV